MLKDKSAVMAIEMPGAETGLPRSGFVQLQVTHNERLSKNPHCVIAPILATYPALRLFT